MFVARKVKVDKKLKGKVAVGLSSQVDGGTPLMVFTSRADADIFRNRLNAEIGLILEYEQINPGAYITGYVK
jgi:hypothetical protein